MKELIERELWNLHRKADQTRSIHGLIKDRYDWINKYTMFFVAIGSAITAMLIFAELSKEQQILIGLLSATIFIASLLPTALRYDSKIEERAVAMKLLGKWIRDTSAFCNTEIDILTDDQANSRKQELLNAYKEIMESSPDIPQRIFNKGKRKHLQKVEISKALSKNPFKKIRTIRKELKDSMNNGKKPNS